MVKKSDEVLATGRRKCAVARVRMTPGTGKIVVNGKEMAEYFPSEALCGYVMQVLKVSETEGKLDIAANIDGGGVAGQAGRCVTAWPVRWSRWMKLSVPCSRRTA